MKYTKRENNRRYKLHHKCSSRGIGIDVNSKTCQVLYKAPIDKFVTELIEEFKYDVQRVLYIDDKRVKNGK